MVKRSSHAWRQDQQRRSKEPHERGRGARKIGNPRYKKVKVWSKKQGKYVKRYVLRKSVSK